LNSGTRSAISHAVRPAQTGSVVRYSWELGRQTAVALSEDDERQFLEFLRTTAEVQILRWYAASPEQIVISNFPPPGAGRYTFRLWNTAFPWSPEFAHWGPDVRDSDLALQFCLKNTAGAPLVEYVRENFENPKSLVRGRVYWNTDFDIYHGPKYDMAAFAAWYDRIVRWLRKHGKRVQITRSWYQYWLPGAWELHSSSASL